MGDESDEDGNSILTRREVGAFIFGGAIGVHLTNLYRDYAGAFSPPEAQPVTSSRPVLGDRDAPITIAYWYDYQCPLCREFEAGALPEIRSEYIDAGVVNIAFKPSHEIGGEDSFRTAHSTHCVWEQSEQNDTVFWEWHTTLYEAFPEQADTGWASLDNIDEMVSSISDLDSESVNACIESEEYANRIGTDWDEADAWGSAGVPKFVVIGDSVEYAEIIEGPQPYPHFADAIETVLEHNE